MIQCFFRVVSLRGITVIGVVFGGSLSLSRGCCFITVVIAFSTIILAMIAVATVVAISTTTFRRFALHNKPV